MTSLREVLVAAIKSLLKGKTLIQAFLAFWVGPGSLKTTADARSPPRRSVEDFLEEAEALFLGPVRGDGLTDFAVKLQAQFRERLWSSPECMLPSYNHQLPNGCERGQYLALDVGGSTLRVALVELRSRVLRGNESGIVRMESFKIDQDIKRLEGMAFFYWMAERVYETISKSLEKDTSADSPLPMGLAWSFPIEQTSLKGGWLHGMGKGFMASNGLIGQDLGDIIKSACKKQGLHVELSAIINDSTAALLSQAYVNSTTRFSLILGTGVNIAVHLPVSTIDLPKYGTRPDGWFEKASHVIVNTELGMFGKDILPMTRWDKQLAASHPRPTFQPLEYLVSGYYLGEMCRFALLEAIDSAGLFGGVVPPSLLTPYSLDTETLSLIEGETSPALETSCAIFQSRHPSPVEPTPADMAALRTLSALISRRSAALVAASLVALWAVKAEAEAAYLRTLPRDSAFASETEAEMQIARTLVAFNGSVIERYPNYQAMCQQYIDDLVAALADGAPGTLDLVSARESSLLGAAVALACLEEGKAN